ncbi:GntR family transcriptional regulator [Streptomyces sp. NPDC056465]|uniref:GntR family transcriptional regulator n=1 Tax=unclassified Streptomyces TaxID=2593676 RepID=UPI0035DD1368
MADGSGTGPAAREGGSRTPATAGAASLSARAREAVLQRIVDRRYAQGARLVEREVAEELSMSRVPVREALRALVTEGLLELLPHSGVRVRRLEYDDVDHLYEVWEPLAVQASRLAARAVARAVAAGGTGELAVLETALRQAESAAASDEGPREVAAHTAFHEGVVALAGNPLLARTMEQLSWQLQLLFGMREEPAHMRAQHAEMYRHISAGDAEAAAACTLLHVRDSRAVALRSLFGDG